MQPRGRNRGQQGNADVYPTDGARKPDTSVRVALLASLDGEPVVKDRDHTDDGATRKAGLRLMREMVRPHRRMMYLGIGAGLTWAIARVAVPTFAGDAIDYGIARGDWGTTALWTALILGAGAVQAVSTGLRRYAAFAARVARRDRPPHEARRAPSASALRVPRPGADRPVDGLREHRHPADQQRHPAHPADDREHDSDARGRRHPVAAQSRARVVRARCAAVPELLRDALQPSHVSRSACSSKRSSSELSGVVEESVTGVRVVKGFGAERLQRTRLAAEAVERLRPLDGSGAACVRASCRSSTCCRRSGSSASSGTAAIRCSHGTLTVGDVVAANLYVLMLIWPLRMIGMLVGQLPRSAAAAGRIDAVLAHRSRDRGFAARPAAARRAGRGALRGRDVRRTAVVRQCSTASTS